MVVEPLSVWVEALTVAVIEGPPAAGFSPPW